MPKITLEVKRTANNKDLLADLTDLSATNGDCGFSIDEEKVGRDPFVSRAPMGGQEAEIASQLIQYFSAYSIIRISIEGVLTNVVWKTLSSVVKRGKKFIASNNRQKGNAWGAKVDITRKLENGETQCIHFFLDGLSENQLHEATHKIEGRMNELDAFLGKEYMSTLKNIGFAYDEVVGEWKMIGVEKLDGTTETPHQEKR